MSLSATLFGRDSAIFKATNIQGLGIPGWLDKKFGAKDLNIEGPRLSDLSVQTSTYGAPIPRLYGTIAVMGNLIWLENNRLKETVRKKKSSSGGKGGGGGSSEPTTTYSYSATFHLALCEGPILGVRRIWCGDKLIYNAGGGDLETILASNAAALGWTLYLGTANQLPSARYEADVGVANASANRGLAYIAFHDFQLADYGNTLQGTQFKVEVVISGAQTRTLMDVELSADTPVTWESGAGFRDDFRGADYLSRRVVGAADVAQINLGKFKSIGTYNVEFHLGGVAVRGCVSYDSNMWLQSNLNDIFDTTVLRRTSDFNYFEIYAGRLVRGIRARIGSPEGHYIVLLTNGGAGTSGTYGLAGVAIAKSDGGIIDPLISVTAGYRINTAGDQLHEFKVSGNTVTFRTYDEDLVFIAQYSVSYSGAALGFVGSPFPAQGIGTQSCMRDGVLYICEEVSGGYRVLAVNSNSVVDDYFVEATAGIAELYAFYMASSSEGYIVNGDRFIQFKRSPGGGAGVHLSTVLDNEIALSSLIQTSDLDVEDAPGYVRGYRITGGSIRSGIEPLRSAFQFDLVSSGYKLKCVPRGQASVADIPWEDISVAGGDASGEVLPQSIEMDTQLPARTTIKYLDADREYAIAEQYSERINTPAVNQSDREMSLVLMADEAAWIAEVLQFQPWLERVTASFSLPPSYAGLEASDVVTLTTPNAVHEYRLTDVNYGMDGRLECSAKQNRAALYVPAASGGEGVPPTGQIPLIGPSILVPLDIPVVDETLQDAPGFVGVLAGDTSNWPGGLVVRSIDSGQTWSDLQAYAGPASLGLARGTLLASTCSLIDLRALTVDMISGDLESITRDQMLTGLNYAAYGVDGRWEIVRFQNATLQGDGSYIVSGFVRGDRGTEWATGLHAAGDYFVLLDDPDNAFIGMAIGSIGVPADYRGITSGGSLDEAEDVPFTYQGVNLECLSAVDARGSRDGSSNFSGTFTRRSRLSSSWWTNGVVAPIGEASESYEIDVMNGSAVVRTITTSTPAFSYSAANQTTDFGSAQSSIAFRIYQLSATVGRGNPLEVTL